MEKTLKLILVIFCVISNDIYAQSQIEKDFTHENYKSLNLGIGYSYSFSDPHQKKFHLLNLEINKSKNNGIAGYQYGVGTEIVLNTERFTIAPKINGMINYQFIILGAELVSYTNFEDLNLRFVPMFGIGVERFRLTINPQITFLNKNYQPINKGLLNLTINLSLKKKLKTISK